LSTGKITVITMMKFEVPKDVVKELEAQVRCELSCMSAFNDNDLSEVTYRDLVAAIADVTAEYLVVLYENMPREMIADIGNKLFNKEEDNG